MGRTPKPDPVKFCIRCGLRLHCKRFSGRLEDYGVFLRRQACDQSCANKREVVTISAHQYRAQKFKGTACERCGATSKLHAHHKDGNPLNTTRENIETVCATCHISGHWSEKRHAKAHIEGCGP